MTRSTRGLLLAGLQLLLLLGVGGKLALDRARYPSVWVPTVPVDPSDPFRGRYVRLQVAVTPRGTLEEPASSRVRLVVEGDSLVAYPSELPGAVLLRAAPWRDTTFAVISTPLAFFIPEDIPDPSILPVTQRLWVEVTVPPRGPPRPIRLAVREDGS